MVNCNTHMVNFNCMCIALPERPALELSGLDEEDAGAAGPVDTGLLFGELPVAAGDAASAAGDMELCFSWHAYCLLLYNC